MEYRKTSKSGRKIPGRAFMEKLESLSVPGKEPGGEQPRPVLGGEIFHSLLNGIPGPACRHATAPAAPASSTAPAAPESRTVPAARENRAAPAAPERRAAPPAAAEAKPGKRRPEPGPPPAAARNPEPDVTRASEINTKLSSIFSDAEEGPAQDAPDEPAAKVTRAPAQPAAVLAREPAANRQLAGIIEAREAAEKKQAKPHADEETETREAQPVAAEITAADGPPPEPNRKGGEEPMFEGRPKQSLQNFVSKIMSELDNIFTDDGCGEEQARAGRAKPHDTVDEGS